jgi:hypothetical protein
LDKFARYYGWFLLFATILPALMRLLQPRQLAVITARRMPTEVRRRRFRRLGIAAVVISLGIIPMYFFYLRAQLWLLLACAIGVLSGVEMFGNASRPDLEFLAAQNRVFGVFYAGLAVITGFWMLHA